MHPINSKIQGLPSTWATSIPFLNNARPKNLHIILLMGVMVFTSACGLNLSGEPEIVSTIAPQPTPVAIGYPETQPDIVLGAQIFAQNCTRCHGINGQGDGELVLNGQVAAPVSFTNREAMSVKTPKDHFEIITNGKIENLMPPWVNALSDDERWAVALYTYTLGYTAEQIERGQAIYAEKCTECHGENGNESGERAVREGLDVGNLTNARNLVTLTDESLYYIIAEGVSTTMPAFADELTEEEINDAITYTRTFSVSNPDAISSIAAIEEPVATDDASPESATLTEPITGSITVSVSNGTRGAEVPIESTLQLLILDEEFNPINRQEARITSGEHTFKDVTIDPVNTYVAIYAHRERQFISQPTTGDTASTDGTLALPITIYELTEDASVLTMERAVIQASVAEGGLRFVEVVFFNNTSDRVFTSSRPLNDEGTLFGSTLLSLPPGAIVAGFATDPNRYIVSEEDFAIVDTQPVFPGEGHSMQVSYFLPVEKDAIIEHQLNYAFEGSARLLVNPQGMEVTSDQIEKFDDIVLGETIYGEYGAELSLQAGDVLRYEINLSARSNGQANLLPTILFVLSGIFGISSLGLYIYSQMNKSESKKTRQVDALVSRIAALDEAHETGRLNHDLWHKQRNELKAELKQVMGGDDEQSTD